MASRISCGMFERIAVRYPRARSSAAHATMRVLILVQAAISRRTSSSTRPGEAGRPAAARMAPQYPAALERRPVPDQPVLHVQGAETFHGQAAQVGHEPGLRGVLVQAQHAAEIENDGGDA